MRQAQYRTTTTLYIVSTINHLAKEFVFVEDSAGLESNFSTWDDNKMNHLAPCRWLPGRTYSSHSESLSHGQTSRGMTNDSPAELVLSSSNVDRAEKEKVPWMSILLAVSSRLWQRRRHRDRCSDLHRTSTSSIHLEIQLRRKFCHHESPQTKNSWIPTHWIAILMKADTTTA